jgi:hypothetical protein
MGQLVWKNNSSKLVRWFVVSEYGSVAEELKPGETYRHRNPGGLMQVGMQCLEAPVYVAQAQPLDDGVDVGIVASDVIPISLRRVESGKPSMRSIRKGPIEIKALQEVLLEQALEPNEVCVAGVDIPDDEKLRGPALVEVVSVRYDRAEDLKTLQAVITLRNPANLDALVYVNIIAIRPDVPKERGQDAFFEGVEVDDEGRPIFLARWGWRKMQVDGKTMLVAATREEAMQLLKEAGVADPESLIDGCASRDSTNLNCYNTGGCKKKYCITQSYDTGIRLCACKD